MITHYLMKKNHLLLVIQKKIFSENLRKIGIKHLKNRLLSTCLCGGIILWAFPNNNMINLEKFCSLWDKLKAAVVQKQCDTSCWSLVWIFYLIHHIHQSSRSLNAFYFDHYKIFSVKKFFDWLKKVKEFFAEKFDRFWKNGIFKVIWKIEKDYKTECHVCNLHELFQHINIKAKIIVINFFQKEM